MSRSERDILADVKKLATEYYDLTGKPLGVTGEIAEFDAAEKLGLELAGARTRRGRTTGAFHVREDPKRQIPSGMPYAALIQAETIIQRLRAQGPGRARRARRG